MDSDTARKNTADKLGMNNDTARKNTADNMVWTAIQQERIQLTTWCGQRYSKKEYS